MCIRDRVYAARPVTEVPPLHLIPRGTTALLDSIGRLVTTAGERLAALPEEARPGTVIVGIMTDGHENASHEWGFGAIRALIEQQTKVYSWEFLYMGADQDAIEVGARLGVSRDQSLTYDRHRVGSAMAAASGNISAMRAARSAGASPAAARQKLAFTEAQRTTSRAPTSTSRQCVGTGSSMRTNADSSSDWAASRTTSACTMSPAGLVMTGLRQDVWAS